MSETSQTSESHRVVLRRWRIAGALTALMMLVYFGFILLVAFAKPTMGTIVVPGLSLGILLGASVIATAWLLTGAYVRWANTRYDAAVRTLRGEATDAPPGEG
jgi:uncharacterized membrane protein (DUF485 family)